MTKLTTLLVSVLLGASSIAMARPAQLPARDSWRDRQELRLEREQASGHRSYRPTWVALSGATKIVRGRDVIQVGAERGRFTQLRFQTTEGTSSIERVLIGSPTVAGRSPISTPASRPTDRWSSSSSTATAG